MKRLLPLLLLLLSQANATVISGRIADLTGQTLTSNRSVVFTLQNCGSNVPTITGAAIIVPGTKTFSPNAAGLLAGTLAGNDLISCGTTIGQTYYKVEIFAGVQKIYEKNYRVVGSTWNLSTAIPLTNDPTAFMNYTGYLLGDLIYGAGTNILGLVRGNTTLRRKHLAQEGDGVNSGQPFWDALPDIRIVELSSQVSPNEEQEFRVAGEVIAALRNVSSPTFPENAKELQILGSVGRIARYSLMGPNGSDYARYAYNGIQAYFDVSAGDLNFRPLSPTGNVNVWAPARNVRLRVGNAGLLQSIDLYHNGTAGHVSSTTGGITMDQDVTVAPLAGSGSSYACLDLNGKLFRSDAPCR